MPISRYPRRGQPIAPSRLAACLGQRVPRFGVLFADLGAGAWEQFGETDCRRLARLLVDHLRAKHETVERLFGWQTVVPPGMAIGLEELELEQRTYNCLKRIQLHRPVDEFAQLTISKALEVRAFGMRSLVDLLASVEAVAGGSPQQAVFEDGGHRSARGALLTALCDILRQSWTLPASIASLCVPAPPPGIRLPQMELSRRTYRALVQAGYRRQPIKLSDLTLSQALQIPGFGIEGLCGFIGAVKRIEETLGEDGNAPGETEDDNVRLLLHLLRAADWLPNSLLQCPLPAAPPGAALDSLRLNGRIQLALKRHGLIGNLERLGKLTVKDVLSIAGVDQRGVVVLIENICRLRESAAMAHPSNKQLRQLLEQLPGTEGVLEADRTDPRLGNLLREIDPNAINIGDLMSRGSKWLAGRLEPIQRLGERIRQCTRKTVEDEALELILTKRPGRHFDRNRHLVIEHLGLSGDPPRTLESVGDKYGVTRERVRQICSPRWLYRGRPPFAPALDRCLALLGRAAPIPVHAAERKLVQRRCIRRGTTLATVLRVAHLVRREPNLEVVLLNKTPTVVSLAQKELVDRIRSIIRSNGSLQVRTVADLLAHCGTLVANEEAEKIARKFLRSQRDFHWLDRTRDLFLLERGSKWLQLRIRKILCVCQRIHIDELYAALKREPGQQHKLPAKSLVLQICRVMKDVRVSNGVIRTPMSLAADKLFRGITKQIVQLFQEHGPACSWDLLQSKAIERGISGNVLYQYLYRLPIFQRLPGGIFALIGTSLPPAD